MQKKKWYCFVSISLWILKLWFLLKIGSFIPWNTLFNESFFELSILLFLFIERYLPSLLIIKWTGHVIMKLLLIFYQKREKLHDEEERKSAWVSQERQRTLDRLRTFKQVIKVWSIDCFSLFLNSYIYTPIGR